MGGVPAQTGGECGVAGGPEDPPLVSPWLWLSLLLSARLQVQSESRSKAAAPLRWRQNDGPATRLKVAL